MEYRIDTSKIKNIQNDLLQRSTEISSVGRPFYSGAFNSSGSLALALLKISKITSNISENLNNIKLYLSDYSSDVENFENAMINGSGNVKASGVASFINGNSRVSKDKLFSYKMDVNTLFHIVSYNPKKTNSTNNKNNAANVNVNSNSSSNSSVSNENSGYESIFNSGFDSDVFDFNFDFLSDDFESFEFSFGDFMSSSFEFSSLNLAPIQFAGLASLGSFSINDNFNFKDFNMSQQVILGELFGKNFEIGDLSSFDIDLFLKDVNLGNFTLNNNILDGLKQQISLGKISATDALNTLHEFFPSTINMNLEEILALDFNQLSSISFLGNIGNFNSISEFTSFLKNLNGVSQDSSIAQNVTGAIQGASISSAMVLGLGLIGGGLAKGLSSALSATGAANTGIGGSGRTNSSKVSSSASSQGSSVTPNSSSKSSTNDVGGNSKMESTNELKQKSSIKSKTPFLIPNLLTGFLFKNDDITQYVFSKLIKFNEVKKNSSYLQLINDANLMRNITDITVFEEKMYFSIPYIFPDLLSIYCYYHEFNFQNFMNSFLSYEEYKNKFISSNSRFKWVNLKFYSYSQCNYESILKKENNFAVVGNFKTVFALLEGYIKKFLAQYYKVCEEEVPKKFYSDMIVEKDNFYKNEWKKLESLSIQATLNNLSLKEAKEYLNEKLLINNIGKSYYQTCHMVRISDKLKEIIYIIRLGENSQGYKYYAFYENVGLREIFKSDVQEFIDSGFRIGEEYE